MLLQFTNWHSQKEQMAREYDGIMKKWPLLVTEMKTIECLENIQIAFGIYYHVV